MPCRHASILTPFFESHAACQAWERRGFGFRPTQHTKSSIIIHPSLQRNPTTPPFSLLIWDLSLFFTEPLMMGRPSGVLSQKARHRQRHNPALQLIPFLICINTIPLRATFVSFHTLNTHFFLSHCFAHLEREKVDLQRKKIHHFYNALIRSQKDFWDGNKENSNRNHTIRIEKTTKNISKQ